MRDLSQWKDKVELSLDGRQLFFLFFGGATLACLLFTLGIMTGRRLEARAIALETPAVDDPLAMLDQLGDLEDEELTYHQALTKDTRNPTKPGDSAALEIDGAAHAKPAIAKPAAPLSAARPAVAAPAPAPKPAPVIVPRPAAPTVKPVGAPRPAHAAVSADDSPDAPVGLPKLPEAAPRAEAAPAPRAEPSVSAKLDVKLPEKQSAKEPGKDSAKEPAVGAVHFTLQLSAFAARRDADDFMRRVQAAGYRPFVVSSDVPGKGIMYRVRIGDFATKDVALSEKTTVEKKLKVVAYLARL